MKTPISYFGVFLVSAIGLAGNAFGQASYLAGIPRNEVLICENPEGRITNPAWFNIWVVNHGGVSTGLQQLARSGELLSWPALIRSPPRTRTRLCSS